MSLVDGSKTFASLLTVLACACSSSSSGGGAPSADGGQDGAAASEAGFDGSAATRRFVLVNGAFLGAWSWSGVKTGLEAHGAKVTVVELPAHGDDATPVSGATLDAYVAAVGAAIDAAGEKVVLVGHSMGGMVITQTAENKPDAISKLVYVAAFVPKDGDSLQALASTDTGSHLGPATTINADGTVSVPVDKLGDIFCADCSQAALSTLQTRYRSEPIAPLTTPVHTTAASWGRVPKAYVYTTQDNAITPAAQQTMTAGVSFVATASLGSSHAPFLSHVDDLVAALLSF